MQEILAGRERVTPLLIREQNHAWTRRMGRKGIVGIYCVTINSCSFASYVGGPERRCWQAVPEHLLGGEHPEQVPRGGRAPLLHHQVGAAAGESEAGNGRAGSPDWRQMRQNGAFQGPLALKIF